MGGPDIPWRPGRTDYVDDSKLPPRGRLPDGAQGAEHLRFVFYRMGFDDKDIVTLSGAHNLGRCHSDRSGFEGNWVNNPTRFSNQYFKLLDKFDWEKKTLPGGVMQYKNEELGTELMMLPTDIALVQDPKFKPWVQKYAMDKDLFFTEFAKVFDRLMELGTSEMNLAKLLMRTMPKVATSVHLKRRVHQIQSKATKRAILLQRRMPNSELNCKRLQHTAIFVFLYFRTFSHHLGKGNLP